NLWMVRFSSYRKTGAALPMELMNREPFSHVAVPRCSTYCIKMLHYGDYLLIRTNTNGQE
ncbi:hypothetical protein HMPREF9069_00846, partial [Atopobium sp. oral taxon 810 str. F0209]